MIVDSKEEMSCKEDASTGIAVWTISVDMGGEGALLLLPPVSILLGCERAMDIRSMRGATIRAVVDDGLGLRRRFRVCCC